MTKTKQAKCGPTHYAGCTCHEQGWENKWKCAVEMAARATVERDELLAAIRAYRDAKGRYHTQLACERLLTFLPENAGGMARELAAQESESPTKQNG
jgi:hypothetical protein